MFDQPSKQLTDRPRDFIRRILLSILKLTGFVAVLFLIVRYFRMNVARIETFSWSNLNWTAVVLFMVALIAIQLFYALLWMLFVRGFGHKISLTDAFVSTYYPVLSKYLPGKGWFQVGRIYLLKKANIEKEAGLTINILEQIVVIYTGLLVSAPLLGRLLQPILVAVILVVATFLTFALLFYQDFFTKLFARFGRFLKIGKSVSFTPKIRPQVMFFYVLFYLINWLLWGLVFKLGTNILDAGNSMSIWLAAGSFAFSSIVGFIIPIAPAGLGVRESALLVFLDKQVNPGALFNVTIGIRLCTITGEVLLFLIAMIFKSRMKDDS